MFAIVKDCRSIDVSHVHKICPEVTFYGLRRMTVESIRTYNTLCFFEKKSDYRKEILKNNIKEFNREYFHYLPQLLKEMNYKRYSDYIFCNFGLTKLRQIISLYPNFLTSYDEFILNILNDRDLNVETCFKFFHETLFIKIIEKVLYGEIIVKNYYYDNNKLGIYNVINQLIMDVLEKFDDSVYYYKNIKYDCQSIAPHEEQCKRILEYLNNVELNKSLKIC